jgi:hypothetical protein
MISRKRLEVARERLEPLTQEELTLVSGGWCGPGPAPGFHHRRRHHHRHHHRHHRSPFFGCGGNNPNPPF